MKIFILVSFQIFLAVSRSMIFKLGQYDIGHDCTRVRFVVPEATKIFRGTFWNSKRQDKKPIKLGERKQERRTYNRDTCQDEEPSVNGLGICKKILSQMHMKRTVINRGYFRYV